MASYVLAKMFSRKMEWGIPIGFRFFIALRRIRLLTCLLPSNVILPTLTFGPSLITNVRLTAFGGIGWISVRMVENCLPVLGQQLLDRDLRLFHLGWIVLALDRQADFGFLETVQHVAFGDRVQARRN